MPQQDMSKKLGTSTSPAHASVTKNSAHGQKVLPVPGAVNQAFNKKPVSVPISKK